MCRVVCACVFEQMLQLYPDERHKKKETARLALLAGLHRLLKLTFSFHVLFIQKHRKISPVTKFGGSGILQFQDF